MHITRQVITLSIATLIVVTGCALARVHDSPPSQSVTNAPLLLTQRVAQVDTEAAEPMIVEHPDGILFVAGVGGPWPRDSEYNSNPAYWDSLLRDRLWQSRDHGATWVPVDLGAGAAGVIGNSDVDLAVAPDGTLYVASMTWADSVREGRRIAVGVSHDVGATWTWTLLSEHRFDDRPWVVVAPDGVAHVIWNDGEGVQHVVSHDGGKTWSPPARVHDQGGSSHLAVGPHGELAARVIPWSASHNYLAPGVDLIAVSTDGGSTWKTHPAPGQRDWGTWAPGATHSGRDDSVQVFAGNKTARRCCSGTIIPRWIEPLAWDGEGRLYALWPDTTGVWLARSADRGATWDVWRIVERPVRYVHGPWPVVHDYERDLVSRLHDAIFYPYLIARGDGELAATWLVREADSLHWQAARIEVGHGTQAPRVVQSSPLELDTFDPDTTRPGGIRRASSAGEYLGVTFLRDGGIGVITPIQVPFTQRLGFTYWRFDRPGAVHPTASEGLMSPRSTGSGP